MTRSFHSPPIVAWAAVALGLVSLTPPSLADPVPDFSLADVNPNSIRYQAEVSPRDYRLQVSAYYFGAAG